MKEKKLTGCKSSEDKMSITVNKVYLYVKNREITYSPIDFR